MDRNTLARRARLIESIVSLASRHGRSVALFLTNFGAAKLAAYAGPLVLARLLDPIAYGGIEFGLSVATFAAGLLSLGVPGALPQMTLLRRAMPLLDILAASVAIPGALSLLVAVVLMLLGGSNKTIYALASICTVLALAQGALSIYCRTYSLRNLAAWSDGAGNLIVVAVGLIAFVVGKPTLPTIAAGTAVCAVLVVIFASVITVWLRKPALDERFRAALRFGAPVLLQSLVIVWCVVSGRIYLGSFLDPQAVALYGASFRIASALLLVHAMLAIALFAKLYAMRTREYDRFLSLYFLFLTVIGLVMIVVFPQLVPRLSLRAVQSVPEAVTLFPVVLLQVLAWGGSASIELRVVRARRAGRAALGIAVVAAGFAAVMFCAAWNGLLTVKVVTWLSALQMIACVMTQFLVLWRRGLRMPRTMLAFVCGIALIGGLALTANASG